MIFQHQMAIANPISANPVAMLNSDPSGIPMKIIRKPAMAMLEILSFGIRL